MIQVDLTHMRHFIALPYEAALAPRLRIAHNHLQKSDGSGGEFTGWVRLPQEYDREEFARIQAAARRIQSDSQALVVIGIGGAYLGGREEHAQHLFRGQRPVRPAAAGDHGAA